MNILLVEILDDITDTEIEHLDLQNSCAKKTWGFHIIFFNGAERYQGNDLKIRRRRETGNTMVN